MITGTRRYETYEKPDDPCATSHTGIQTYRQTYRLLLYEYEYTVRVRYDYSYRTDSGVSCFPSTRTYEAGKAMKYSYPPHGQSISHQDFANRNLSYFSLFFSIISE
jgi:hypothetical protein